MELCYPQQKDGMYILNRHGIEDIATNVLKEQFPTNLEYPTSLKTETLLDKLGLQVKHKYLGIPGHEILGATIMGDSAELPGYDMMMNLTVFEERLWHRFNPHRPLHGQKCSQKEIYRGP